MNRTSTRTPADVRMDLARHDVETARDALRAATTRATLALSALNDLKQRSGA